MMVGSAIPHIQILGFDSVAHASLCKKCYSWRIRVKVKPGTGNLSRSNSIGFWLTRGFAPHLQTSSGVYWGWCLLHMLSSWGQAFGAFSCIFSVIQHQSALQMLEIHVGILHQLQPLASFLYGPGIRNLRRCAATHVACEVPGSLGPWSNHIPWVTITNYHENNHKANDHMRKTSIRLL